MQRPWGLSSLRESRRTVRLGMVDGGLEGVEVERGGEISRSKDFGFYSGSDGSFGCLEESRVVI